MGAEIQRFTQTQTLLFGHGPTSCCPPPSLPRGRRLLWLQGILQECRLVLQAVRQRLAAHAPAHSPQDCLQLAIVWPLCTLRHALILQPGAEGGAGGGQTAVRSGPSRAVCVCDGRMYGRILAIQGSSSSKRLAAALIVLAPAPNLPARVTLGA